MSNSNFQPASELVSVTTDRRGNSVAVCPKCGDKSHTAQEHDSIYPDPCMCRFCPLAKQGLHDIPHGAPNTCMDVGYFCPDCLNAMGSGLEKDNFRIGWL